MRALVFEGPGRLSLGEVARPEPGKGEVLIRVHAAAICGTDVRIVSGRKTRDVRVGHPIGHECAGTVTGVGPGVEGYSPGDRVAVCVVVSCGACEYCWADKENLCDTRITLGYHTDGAFAEYMLIPARAVRRGNLFRLPDEIPMATATLLEPMACCINGQHEMGLRERAVDSLVIFGAGPIGLLHLMLAKGRRSDGGTERQREGWRGRGGEGEIGSGRPPSRRAETHVTVIEPGEQRRGLAQRFGADEVLDPQELRPSGQFDAAILAVGAPELVNVALSAVRKGGRVNLFAGFDRNASAAIDPNLIHYHQLGVTGASESRRRDYAEAMSLVTRGVVDPSVLITHRFRLENHEEAFRIAGDGSALKVVFEID